MVSHAVDQLDLVLRMEIKGAARDGVDYVGIRPRERTRKPKDKENNTRPQ